MVRLLEAVELGRPHLVLADFGGNEGLAVLGQFIEPLDRVLRHDDVAVRLVGQRVACAPLIDLRPPVLHGLGVGFQRRGPPDPHQVFQNVGDIADDRQVDIDRLVDGGRIDVDMNLLRVRREGIGPAGDAVVEASPDADHHIAVVHGHVGFVGAMHAQHAEPVVAGRRIGAEAHQRGGDREAGQRHQFAQQLAGLRAGVDHTAAV